MKSEAYSSMVFFLIISLESLSIISATPNTNCISGADTIFIQTAVISNIDSIVSKIIRLYFCCNNFSFH